MIQDNSFPFFHENQVLTEAHLNSLVTYLEQQDRKSRILIGSGIHCGLNVSLHAAGSMIKLSSGSGSTTQGYLLSIPNERQFRYFQEFILPEGSEANYLYHSGDTKITLYELLENDLDPHDTTEKNKHAHEIKNTLTPGPSITLNLHDMTVILHLEIVTADLTTCKIDSCDNEGFEQQLHWRALLIAKNDLKKLIQEDLNFSETVQQYFHAKYQVHEARIPLPKFNCLNTQSYAQIHQNYLYICKMAFQHLKVTFERAKKAYQRTLSDINLDFNITKLEENLAHYEENIDSDGIQYFYAHLKDIALAINEFTNTAFQYQYAYSLNRERYPNYLMAGSFRSGDYNDLKDDIYRHYFEPYCQDTASTNAHKELRNLYQRVNALISSYFTYFVEKSDSVSAGKRLFITPESRHSGTLGDLIPAYYYSDNDSLRRRWNQNNFAHQQLLNIPRYWQRENLDAADWMQDSNNALRFRLDRQNCYHIEGHLGMTKTAFEEAFNKLKEQFNLEIDLKVLEAKQSDECEYKQPYDLLLELEALYEIEAKEISCYLTKLFDMFKEDYQVTVDSSDDDTGTQAANTLEECKKILQSAYQKIKENIDVNDIKKGSLSPSALKEFIIGLNLRCPGDEKGTTSSYYIVDLTEIEDQLGKVDGKINIFAISQPLIIEKSNHHGNSQANVLYIDGEIDTLSTNTRAYQNLVNTYVSKKDDQEKDQPTVGKGDSPVLADQLSKLIVKDTVTYRRAMDTARDVQLMVGGQTQLNSLEIIEKLIREEQDPDNKKELRDLRGKLLGGWYGSATEEEKVDIPFSTITVIDEGTSYTFYEYNKNIAKAFYDADEIDKLISMLAALVYTTRQAINNDKIEAGSSQIKSSINDLDDLSKNIALLLETWDDKEREFEIHKCLLLPIFIGIYQRCWAASFINIKLKYITAKAAILDPITLPQYVHNYPGIKHIGGVPVGGTLIVAFKAYNETTLYDDFEKITLPSAWKGYTPEVLASYEAYVDDMGQGLKTISGARNEIIVADFCLPYRCCAETSSVEYVVFVELKLDMPDEVCNETDRVQIQFTPNGAIPSGEHVQQDADDEPFYFTPAGLDAGPYEVTLSLADKTIKRTITVFAPPAATYTVSPEDAPATVGDEKVWTFQADEPGMTYKWYRRQLDLGDTIFDEVNDSIIAENDYELVKIQPTYELKSASEESLDFELVLLVTNGPCRVYSKPLRYSYRPELQWAIIPKTFCNSLQTPQLLHYTPENATLIGLGELKDKVKPSGDGYDLLVDNVPQGAHEIEMSLPNYDPVVVPITVLQSPTASFNLVNETPTENDAGLFSLDFKAVEEGCEYQWYLEEELLPQETNQTYTHSWEKQVGLETVLVLEVSNMEKGVRCSSRTDMELNYDAQVVDPEASITFPDIVCADNGRKPIVYSPQSRRTFLTGSLDFGINYVNFNEVTGDAFFNTEGLKPGKKYPIILIYKDKETVQHTVEICTIPKLGFSDEKGKDPETKRDVTIFKSVAPADAFTYKWISFSGEKEKVLSNGPEYKHFWKPNVNSTLHLKLRVIDGECICESAERTFSNHGGGSLDRDSLEFHLRTSLAAFEDDTQVPADIKMYVEKIIEANGAILESMTPPEPDIDPEEYALTKIDAGSVTRRIGSNLENTNMILDKLNFMEFDAEGRERVETFIKATLASTSEILLAKTMDIDDSTETFDYLSNVIPKTTELFKIDETTEAKPELMERLKTKTNISRFIEVVGKL